MKKIILGITGASGSIYALRLLEILKDADVEVHIIPSKVGCEVFKYETDKELIDVIKDVPQFKIEKPDDFFSSIASGSYQSQQVSGMVILPCSVSTVGHIANGISANLLHRAALVCLKEKINLVMAVREMPLTSIDLQNLLTLSNNGATVLPLSPGFYHKPKTYDDIINFIVGKVLDSLKIENDLYGRWKGTQN